MGRKRKKTKPLALIWSQDEEEKELANDVRLWRMIRKRLVEELGLRGFGHLDKLLNHCYGEDHHFLGIMAMPWKELLKDLRRTRKLQEEQEVLGVDPRVDGGEIEAYGAIPGRPSGYTIYPKEARRASLDEEDSDPFEGLTVLTEEEITNSEETEETDFTNEDPEGSDYEE